MQKLKLLLVMVCISTISHAQSDFTGEEKMVYDVVIQLFDGMRAGDSSMVSDVFKKDVQLYTVATDREGNPILHKGSLDKFLTAVGTPHDKVWDEPIWNTEIRVDGRLAQVWTDYAFYLGKDFSHCGVDAFELYKTEEGWKIFHLADTRKREGCEVPEYIKAKRK